MFIQEYIKKRKLNSRYLSEACHKLCWYFQNKLLRNAVNWNVSGTIHIYKYIHIFTLYVCINE